MLLATDLDGTFIGDDEAMFALWDGLDARDIQLVFVTGRHLRSVEQFYEEHGTMRRAVASVCMVGTEVYRRDDHGYYLDRDWQALIATGWERERAVAIVEAEPAIEPQALEWQSPLKASYLVDAGFEARLGSLRRRLDDAGVGAKIVYSGERFLDVLPERAGKGEALKYLASRLGTQPADVITAGDTGNDLDMMRPELGFRSIVVANASPELAGFDAPHVYHAEAPYAAGITEGLEHFGWL